MPRRQPVMSPVTRRISRGVAQRRLPRPVARVLVVDDHPVHLLVAKLTWTARGMVCDTASGPEAAQAVLSVGRYDLVLMDFHMPGASGADVTAWLRAQEAERGLRRTPVFGFSAGVSASERNLALNAGMDGFVAKPLPADQLDGLLERVREARRRVLRVSGSPPQVPRAANRSPADDAAVDGTRAQRLA